MPDENRFTEYEKGIDDRGIQEKKLFLITKATQEGKDKEKRVPLKIRATTLIISDGSEPRFKNLVPLWARYTHQVAPRNVQFVNSWNELANLLKKYDRIERLVLFFHGDNGAIMIGGQGYDLDSQKALNHFKGDMPKIRNLDFEGCNIGKAPEMIIPFAKLFEAETIYAWNHFHVLASAWFKGKMPKEQIELNERKYKDYIIGNSQELAKFLTGSGDRQIAITWFMEEYPDPPSLPDPPSAKEHKEGKFDFRDDRFKPIKNASEKHIGTMHEALEYHKEFETARFPLHRVIIKVPYD